MSEEAKIKYRSRWKRKSVIALVSVLLILLVVRLMLPYIVLRYVNNKLSELTEYRGNVRDIEIALIRGAYVIKQIRLEKRGVKKEKSDSIPFFTSPRIDLSIEWSALLHGAVVGEIYAEEPKLNFVKGKHKHEDVRADTADFRKIIDDLMPLTVNHFEIKRGQIHYIDKNSSPNIDISMKQIEAIATNLSNVNKSAKILPAHCDASGHAYEGDFKLVVDFDGLNKVPTFDMKAELKNLNIVQLNDFFKAYGNFETKKGRIGIYTEFAAKKGEFGGYVKPIIKDMQVVQGKGPLKQEVWELFVGVSSKILKNPATKEIGTKVDINGRFDQPSINIWRAVSFLLRNAFVQALKPSIDHTISINKLNEDGKKTLLEKLLGSGKKKNKK